MTRTELFAAIRKFAPEGRFLPSHVQTIDALADAFGLPPEHGRTPSPAIIGYIRDVESLAKKRADGRVEAYMPTPDDVPTIGYGSTGPDITLGTIWTVAQCEARFARDLNAFASKVADMIGQVPTTQGQFDAMVSLAYNIGEQGFHSSTLLRLHKKGDYNGAAAQFARWNKQAGKVLNGLTKRRAVEAAFYAGANA